MHSSWLEEVRFNLQSIQVLEKAIISEMLAIQDNPKDKSMAEHRIHNFAEMIQQKAKEVTSFMREETAMKKEEMLVIEGQKSLKGISDKKKPADVIWQNFYDKSKELKEQFRRQEGNSRPASTINTVQYFRASAFKPPFKQPDFSLQENKGKYVDMHGNYMEFLNVCKIMSEQKESNRLHDYLWFLQNLDKFDDFPVNKKFKNQSKFMQYLNNLEEYLKGFIRRARPLFALQEFCLTFPAAFQAKYAQGRLNGWQKDSLHFDESKCVYCSTCRKLLINESSFVSHLNGERHKKLAVSSDEIVHDPEEESKAKAEYVLQNQKRKKSIAFVQFKISKFKEELANVIYDTMNLVRKKQARGYEQIQDNVQSQSSSEQGDAPIYNPKNLPLGWDGKPIPYWLYKLHGLGIEYKCQICGNYSYWGRRAFEMHFQEWRHTYGMKCLKIPNTIHFKDITTINDALALHEKLTRESQEAQFRPDIEEEYEDNEGNLLNKKTYMDMKKQGLIDN